jgi:hypothetical protein
MRVAEILRVLAIRDLESTEHRNSIIALNEARNT